MKRKRFGTFLLASILGAGMLASFVPATAASAAGASDGVTVQDNTFVPPVVLTDKQGNVYDLGGMEVVIRDWWTNPDFEDPLTEERQEYLNWIQQTYNFTIRREGISNWEDTPQDYVDYVLGEGDANNYVFVLREDPAVYSPLDSRLFYDLATLDCLDFSERKFQLNLTHEVYSKKNHIYGMYTGYSEPRTGVFFNKRILTEAGIPVSDVYDLQKSNIWVWENFVDLCKKVQKMDNDKDGEPDVAACGGNSSVMIEAAVYSAGGAFVGKDENGNFTYELESDETIEGLIFAQDLLDNYWYRIPEGEKWDYYSTAWLNGEYAFLVDEAWNGQHGGLMDELNDDWGFVMFPRQHSANMCVNCWSNNFYAIPSCYDADRAWKIAFAWNLYTNEVPEDQEDSVIWKDLYDTFDQRAVDETLTKMRVNGVVAHHGLVPYLDVNDVLWNMEPDGLSVGEIISLVSDEWKTVIDQANKGIMIGSISINGLTPPVVGAIAGNADGKVIDLDTSAYRIVDQMWSAKNKTSVSVNVFEAGVPYYYTVWLEPMEGYYFPEHEMGYIEGADTLPIVTVNGDAAWSRYIYDDGTMRITAKYFAESGPGTMWSASANFKDVVELNFYCEVPQSVLATSGAYVTMTQEGKTKKVLVKDGVNAKISGHATKRFSFPMSVKQMRDDVVFRLFDGAGKEVALVSGSGVEYGKDGCPMSIVTYCDKLIANSTDQKMVDLAKAVKDYGTAVQLYLGYKTTGLSVSQRVKNLNKQIVIDGYAPVKEGTAPTGVEGMSLTLAFESECTLRVYFNYAENVGAGRFSYSIDDKSTSIIRTASGKCYLEITGIRPKYLDEPHVFKISGGKKSQTLTISALTYASLLCGQEKNKQVNLGKAMYLYNQATQAYFGK